MFNCVSFLILHSYCDKWEGVDPLTGLTTPVGFGGVFVLSRFFFCGRRGFCHRTESDPLLFLQLAGVNRVSVLTSRDSKLATRVYLM